jgi:hypothetical protein
MHAHRKVSPFLLAGHLRMYAMCEQRLGKPPLISCVHDAAAVAVEKFTRGVTVPAGFGHRDAGSSPRKRSENYFSGNLSGVNDEKPIFPANTG